jgi:hypothetical protein
MYLGAFKRDEVGISYFDSSVKVACAGHLKPINKDFESFNCAGFNWMVGILSQIKFRTVIQMRDHFLYSTDYSLLP